MSQRKLITRRQFFTAGGTLAVGALAAACSQPAQPAPATQAPAPKAPAAQPTAAAAAAGPTAAAPKAVEAPKAAAAPGAYKESPMLTELVKAGKLPPIEQRLPKDPYVASQGTLMEDSMIKVKVGKFGGVMRMAQEGPAGDPHIYIGNNEPLIWAPGGFEYAKGIHGNICSKWEVNADDTEYTFVLRDGLKWSDGQPCTTEDFQFSVEDVLANAEITPAFPVYLRSGNAASGNKATFKVVDKTTFKIVFDKPYGSFPAVMAIAGWKSYADILRPKHYLKQFHTKYTPLDQLKPMMVKESIPEDKWFNLFNARQMGGNLWKGTTEGGIGIPGLTPWIIKKAESGVFTYERNPYYFKVDTEGNQLPYIDGIRSEVVNDKEALTARGLMGEFDYLGERASLKKLALMKEKEAAGQIKVLIPKMHRLPINFALNLGFADPNWRKVTWDKRFRQALSFAINRPEIIKQFYLGQFAKLPARSNPVEFSIEKANKLLDEIGLDKKDSEGFRLGPDGKRFTILFEIRDLSEDHMPMSELIAEYWKKVGVHTTAKRIDAQLFGPRWNANEIQASALWAHETIWPSGGWDDYLPGNNVSVVWQTWYTTQGKSGEEPPADAKAIYENHEKFMLARIGSPESKAAIGAIYKSYIENVWTFNVAEDSYYPTFFTKKMQNVPVGQYEGLGISVMHSQEMWYMEG